VSQVIGGVLINFGYGLLYYIVELDQDTSSDQRKLNVIFLTFFFPVLISYTAGIYKWRADQWKMNRFTQVLFLTAQVACIMFSLVVGLAVNWIWGGALFGFFAILAMFVVVGIKYVENDFYLPFLWQGFLLFITTCVCVIGIIVGIFVDGVGAFIGFSISYFSILGFAALYGLGLFIRDYRKLDIAPIFFSPWVFPIFKYDPKKDCLKKHNVIGVILFGVLAGLLVWSILCAIWVKPMYVGIGIGSLIEVLICLCAIWIAGVSPM
jgi:hypothetical protein